MKRRNSFRLVGSSSYIRPLEERIAPRMNVDVIRVNARAASGFVVDDDYIDGLRGVVS